MGERGEVNFSSMDETALLALGILLEEAAEEVLGERGDMVFVEGEETEKTQERKDLQTEAMEVEVAVTEEDQQRLIEEERPAAKRRKGKKKAKESKKVHDHDDSG